MNSHLLTSEERYMEQKIRDDNNPGCIEYCKQNEIRKNLRPKLTEQQKLLQEEAAKKYREDEIAGYESKRYDFPQYHWWMDYHGKKYLRSSKNLNVYDYIQPSIIIGTWNDAEKKIEFVDDKNKKISFLEEEITKMKAEIAKLKSRLE